MLVALLCSARDLGAELEGTLVWRRDVDRHWVRRVEDALVTAREQRPHVVLVDPELPGAEGLVRSLRETAATRHSAIVVVARQETGAGSAGLLDAGANAVLTLPPTAEWNERLRRLVDLPSRKEVRLAVQIEAEAALERRTFPVMALNLSRGGMLIETHTPLALGDEIRIVFTLPGSVRHLSGTALVVRQAVTGRFGLEFRYLQDDGLERIRNFVESRPTRP